MNPLHESFKTSKTITNLWQKAQKLNTNFKSIETKYKEELDKKLEIYKKKIETETNENKSTIEILINEKKIEQENLKKLEREFDNKKLISTQKIKELEKQIDIIEVLNTKMLAHYKKLQENDIAELNKKIKEEKEKYSKQVNNHRLQIQKIGTPLRKNDPIPKPRGTRSRSAALRENRSRNRSVERGTTSRTRSASRGSIPRSASRGTRSRSPSKTTYTISL